MNVEKQIKELNDSVLCTIAPSPIHGVGVFALRDIKKGERLFCKQRDAKWYNIPYERFSELYPEIASIILARRASVINGSMFESPNTQVELIAFMNHSDTPNYNQNDTALRDIKAGEEIVEDYREMPRAKEVFSFL